MTEPRDLTDEEIAALPVAAPHTVPHAVDPHRWAFRGGGITELPDGLGGYLREHPEDKRALELDEAYRLSGEQTHHNPSGDGFTMVPLETDAEADRRRRLLERLREHEIEPEWEVRVRRATLPHKLLSRARRPRD